MQLEQKFMNTSIPGPSGRPIVGSVLDLVNEGPEFLVRLAAEYGKITRFKLFNRSMHLISDPDLIREVLVTKSKFFRKSDRDVKLLSPTLGMGLVTTNGEQHKRQRKLTQPAFHARRISNYAETMTDYTQRLIADWRTDQQIDMSEQMMELTMFIVCKTLFDTDWDSMETMAKRVGTAIETLQSVTDENLSMPFLLPEWLPTRNNRRMKASSNVLTETINHIVAERRAKSTDGSIEDTGDLLSMLLLSEYDDGTVMDDKEIRDQLVTLFSAGHETTSNALSWTWYLLSQHPEALAKLHHELDTVLTGRTPTMADLADLPYTEMVVKESMRIYPPAWLLNVRQANEEVTIGDYTLPKDATIMVSPYVMHHHPTYFPEPMRFEPERFLPEYEEMMPKFAYFPFGGGPRICIGNAFAMMEAQLIVATMAQKFRFELEPGQQVQPNAQITMSPLNGLKMRIVEREVTLAQDSDMPNHDLLVAVNE